MRLVSLIIKDTADKGRGVFSTVEVLEGSIIEICPIIIVPKEELIHLDKTKLYDYYFVWDDEGRAALALGYGSLYNHSESPNAEFSFQKENRSLIVKSLFQIKENDEVTVDYTGGGGELWWNKK